MYYYDVLVRGAGGPKPVLTYASSDKLTVGQIVSVSVGRRRAVGLVLAATGKPSFPTRAVTKLVDQPLPPPMTKLLGWLSEYYAASPAQVLRLMTPSSLPKKVKPPLPRSSKSLGLDKLKLNQAQARAVELITNSPQQTAILHGETASGKTLVYRELIKQTLAKQRSAILLVPEISLTPQVANSFADLTEQVIVSHSHLTQAERQRIWLYCLQQKQPILLIGPRSSLFYPLADLGIIVIDEAHQQTYKQEQSPRYQAQTVAAKLAQLHTAKLVLGSATPRVSDYWLAQTKRAPIITLPRHSPHRPKIIVVDQTQPRQFNRSHLISDPLLAAIEKVTKNDEQALLYLNRRGTASLVICTDCGWVPACPRCQVPLNLHHDQSELVCHQCGWRQGVPVNCPVCGSDEIFYRGPGTKTIEREISRLLPSARVGRFDSDNPKHLSFNELYPKVYEREINVLIGTQSLAHGLDLPALKLVGVVSADSELYLPDFSAAERAFQLLFQVIGRAGRQGGGQVIVQSHNPSHPALVSALNQDYASFYSEELTQRKQQHYPPFGHLMAAVTKHRSAPAGLKAAKRLAEVLKDELNGVEILGPAPAFYFKRKNHFRYVLVVKSSSRPRLVEAADIISRQPNWVIDLDPSNLLF